MIPLICKHLVESIHLTELRLMGNTAFARFNLCVEVIGVDVFVCVTWSTCSNRNMFDVALGSETRAFSDKLTGRRGAVVIFDPWPWHDETLVPAKLVWVPKPLGNKLEVHTPSGMVCCAPGKNIRHMKLSSNRRQRRRQGIRLTKPHHKCQFINGRPSFRTRSCTQQLRHGRLVMRQTNTRQTNITQCIFLIIVTLLDRWILINQSNRLTNQSFNFGVTDGTPVIVWDNGAI